VIIVQRRPLVIPGLDGRVAGLQADILIARRRWQALALEIESTSKPERCAQLSEQAMSCLPLATPMTVMQSDSCTGLPAAVHSCQVRMQLPRF